MPPVPTKTCGMPLVWSTSITRESPKSASFTLPHESKSTFSGLMLWWVSPYWCAARSA